jgi:hypothetical protein
LRADKQDFLLSLQRLNRIRNVVMHPVKGIRLTDEDFEFVRRLHAQLAVAEQKAEQRLEQAQNEEHPKQQVDPNAQQPAA